MAFLKRQFLKKPPNFAQSADLFRCFMKRQTLCTTRMSRYVYTYTYMYFLKMSLFGASAQLPRRNCLNNALQFFQNHVSSLIRGPVFRTLLICWNLCKLSSPKTIILGISLSDPETRRTSSFYLLSHKQNKQTPVVKKFS